MNNTISIKNAFSNSKKIIRRFTIRWKLKSIRSSLFLLRILEVEMLLRELQTAGPVRQPNLELCVDIEAKEGNNYKSNNPIHREIDQAGLEPSSRNRAQPNLDLRALIGCLDRAARTQPLQQRPGSNIRDITATHLDPTVLWIQVFMIIHELFLNNQILTHVNLVCF